MPEEINEFDAEAKLVNGDGAAPDEHDQPTRDPADVRLPRLSTREVSASFFDHILELDLPILKTAIGMTLRPGVVCREYVDGYRRRYTNPMKYAFLTATFLVIVYSLFGISPSRTVFGSVATPQTPGSSQTQVDASNEAERNNNQTTEVSAADVDEYRPDKNEQDEAANPDTNDTSADADDELRAAADERAKRIRARAVQLQTEVVGFVEGNLHLFSFFALPFVAVVFTLLFRRAKLNFAEHYSFVLLVWGQAFLFQSFAALVGLHSSSWGFLASAIGVFCYEIWAIKVFYGQGLIISFAKLLLITLIDSVIGGCLGIGGAIAWTLYKFWQVGAFA